MARLRVHNLTLSLDGYAAGPHQSHDHPLGVGGERLHEWAWATRSFRALHGLSGGRTGTDDDLAAAATEGIGATIMGRHMFGPVRGGWGDGSWRGWWGEDPPYHHPVFVLTHHPREPLVMAGGTTFHFVTDGVEAALARAFEAAAGLDVSLAGGAATIHEFLTAGLVDQLHLAVVPLVLGAGARVFEPAHASLGGLTPLPLASSPAVAHFRFSRP